jgi:hypothetical protein
VAGANDILEAWQKDGIEWVRFELPDMHGTSRSKTVPIRHAIGYAQRGLNMYGGASVLDSRSDVVGGTLYNEERRYGDQLLFPDPATAAVVRGPIGRPGSSATPGGTTTPPSMPPPGRSTGGPWRDAEPWDMSPSRASSTSSTC